MCYLNRPTVDLFPKLNEPMCGRLFSSLEELSTDVIRAIRHMNKNGVLDGIIILPKRWTQSLRNREIKVLVKKCGVHYC